MQWCSLCSFHSHYLKQYWYIIYWFSRNIFSEFWMEILIFFCLSWKCIWKCRLRKSLHLDSTAMCFYHPVCYSVGDHGDAGSCGRICLMALVTRIHTCSLTWRMWTTSVAVDSSIDEWLASVSNVFSGHTVPTHRAHRKGDNAKSIGIKSIHDAGHSRHVPICQCRHRWWLPMPKGP